MRTCTVCFAGNPNVGKSTIFNALTGLRQHTGNWTGKTVDPAAGRWTLDGVCYRAVDLPGSYSMDGGTPEEVVAADWLQAHPPDCLVVILDATALERSLPLALELRSRFPNTVLCLNLMDEAERLGLHPDPAVLAQALDAPTVVTRVDRRQTVEHLRRVIAVAAERTRRDTAGTKIGLPASREVLLARASELAREVCPDRPVSRRDPDRILLGTWTAWPAALLLLFGILYLTIRGANLPSRLLESALTSLGDRLRLWLQPLPKWSAGLLVDGIYDTTARVVSVMLPPMAIFFPLFTLLEDLGWLPRLAVLLDRPFACAGTCGRQGLTMCMGLGCNAVGVTGCRIIPARMQRLAAILTNVLTPCNGRFSTLILLLTFLGDPGRETPPFARAAMLTGLLLLSVLVTLAVTRLLRKTLLRGSEERFVLELPPFRKPRVGQILVRSVLDRTGKVLARAVLAAAPAGVILWLLRGIEVSGRPILRVLAGLLDRPASCMGISGSLLLAFLLSFPANELLLPLWIGILGAGADAALTPVLTQAGMGPRMAVCAILLVLFHWPCATALLTIRRETGSRRWTLLAFLLPTAVGFCLSASANLLWKLFGSI